MTAKMTPKINNLGHDAETIVELTLLNRSVHFLTGEIEEENIRKAVQWILYENFQSQDTNKMLTLYINSQGGSLYDALSLVDVMGASLRPIRTIAIGSIMSAAFLIFASGTKGERYISPNTGIMCHQFSEGTEAKYHDIKAQMKETELCNQRMLEILKYATGLPTAKVKSKLLPPSDMYFTAQEMIDLGIADQFLL
jgi:ATP-dependent Clp protease protease subunit